MKTAVVVMETLNELYMKGMILEIYEGEPDQGRVLPTEEPVVVKHVQIPAMLESEPALISVIEGDEVSFKVPTEPHEVPDGGL